MTQNFAPDEHHRESDGQVDYQKVGMNESSHTQEFFKYGQEYTDCALEEF